MPLKSQDHTLSLATIQLSLDAISVEKNVQVCLICELSVYRSVFIPTPNQRFLASAAPIWRSTLYGPVGLLRVEEQQREIVNTSLDLLTNAYHQANP